MGGLILKVLHVEWIQWSSRRESRFSVLFLLVATAGYGALVAFLLETDLAPAAVSLITGTEPTGFHLAYTTVHAVARAIVLFTLLWASTSVAGELEQGTLRMPLLRVPRAAFPLGKALFFWSVAAVLTVLVLLVALVVGAWSFGLESVDVGRVTVQSRGDLAVSGAVAVLLTWLPLGSVVALGVCMSCFARSAQLALTLSISGLIVLWGAGLVPGLGNWVFASTLSWPLEVALGHSEGLKTMSYHEGVWRHCLVNLAWTGGMLSLGSLRLERRDLTT